MCQYFGKRGFPVSVVQECHHYTQKIDLQSALQTAEKENTDRISFTLAFTLKTTQLDLSFLKTLNYFKTIQRLVLFFRKLHTSCKRDKNVGNFLVRSSFQTNYQTGTFKCARSQCKTCPFIHNVEQLSGLTRSIKISDHFKCTSTNVIYCTTCTYCETGRRLGDRFREHLRDVERNDKDASKPVARHLNLPYYSKQHMEVCGLSIKAVRKAAKL